MADKPRAFISYARKDGEQFAKELRERLEREEPGITLWQDRTDLEGGVGWWKQIEAALDVVQFMVLVMSPAALQSEITRKEWRYARQQGVEVYPVKGVPDAELDYDAMPRWMSKAHFFDLDHEWDTFINYLKSPPRRVRVPFMAPDRPESFVDRPAEFGHLLDNLLDAERDNPVAITTALHGAGGFGKTTLAVALCHNDDVITAFDDGILWATLGENPRVQDELTKLYAALTGERPAFVDAEDAARNLAERLEDRDCLIVIDDAWDAAHLRPFLRGGKRCARLITTRNFDILAEAAPEARRVNVDQMRPPEAVQTLIAGIDPQPEDLAPFEALARNLGEWPLLLALAGAALRQRVARGDTLEGALAYVGRAFERKGVTAFDHRNAAERQDAIAKCIEVSLEWLDPHERERYIELAVFPEDTDVPLTTVAALWGLDDFDTEELVQQLDDCSLLKFSLQTATLRVHDVLRAYLARQLLDPAAVHLRLLEAWDALPELPDEYAWRWAAYHLAQAGRTEDLRRLLLDFEWIEAKLDATDVNAIMADYDHLPDDEAAGRVQGALRLSAHVLTGDKAQLASQLHGRLTGDKSAALQTMLESARPARLWLRPLSQALTPPGGPLIRTLTGHADRVNSVALTPDGRRAVSGSRDKTLKVWDLETGEELRTLTGHWERVSCMALTPDGRRAVSGSLDQTLKVWDLDTGAELHTLHGHTEAVLCVALTPDGRRAVSGSWDSTLKVWDLETGEELRTLTGHTHWLTSVALTPDGRRAVSGSWDSTLKVWDLETGEELRTLTGHRGWVTSVPLTPDGRRAVSGSVDHTLKVWDLETGAEVRTLTGHMGPVECVALTADGRRAISGSQDDTLKVWDLETGEELRTLTGHTSDVVCVAVTPDGHRSVSGSQDDTLKVWDLEAGVELPTVTGHTWYVSCVAFTPDGRRAVSGSWDRTVRVWDIETGEELRTLTGHTGWVYCVAFTPDARGVVSSSKDKTLRLWDLETGECIAAFIGEDALWACAVAPDGVTFVAGDMSGRVHILRLEGAEDIEGRKAKDEGREASPRPGRGGKIRLLASKAERP